MGAPVRLLQGAPPGRPLAVRNRIQPDIEELLGRATERIRAMRRAEAIQRLVDQGWSEQAARAWLDARDGPIAAWRDEIPTKREAQGKPLANRSSGRKRRRPPRRWRRWEDGA